MQVDNQQTNPDFEFDAYLHYPDRDPLLCGVRLWRPKDPSEDARLALFVPGIQDTDRVFSQGPLTLKSETWESDPTFVVTATDVHIKRLSGQLNLRKAGGITIELRHVGCMQIEQSWRRRDSKSPEITDEHIQSLSFDLSALKYAQPTGIPTSHYLGDRKAGILKTYSIEFNLPPGTLINFSIEKHYSNWEKLDEHKEITSTRPVFSVKEHLPSAVSEIDQRKSLADDLALLVSLAARHRVLVIGLNFSTPHRMVSRLLNPLARNRVPREECEVDPLIPIQSFEEFSGSAILTFLQMSDQYKSLIKNAIVALHPLVDISAESHFLAMFAALEALSKTDQSEVSSEVLDAWASIEQALTESIDEKLSSFSVEARQFLQRNLNQLKRGKKTEEKLTGFLNAKAVYIRDLFPLFGRQSLTWIRNEIAHGRTLSGRNFGALLHAHDHLAILLERTVLRMLGANSEKSAVSLQRFRKDPRYLAPDELQAIQQQLNEGRPGL